MHTGYLVKCTRILLKKIHLPCVLEGENGSYFTLYIFSIIIHLLHVSKIVQAD